MMSNMRMRKTLVFAAATLFGVFAFRALAAYDVKPSGICPAWSGAEPGVWTQDYAAATNAAAQAGKPVIVMTTGMWWCPHCQALERKVLSQKAWADFVGDIGAYLVALDFPYRGTVSDAESHKTADFDVRTQRPGWGFQCWLYNEEYRAANGLLDADVFKLIEERNYAWQNSLGLPTATTVTIGNWDATGTITYRRVGYPTLLVLGPDGRVRGRPPCTVTADSWAVEDACEYVIGNVRTVLLSDEWDEADDLAATAPFLADPECSGELVVLDGQTLSSIDKADWHRIEIPEAYGEQWTFCVSPREGFAAPNLALAVSSDSAGKSIVATVNADAAEGSVSVVFPAAGTYYVKVAPAKALTSVAGYVFGYGYDEAVVPASFATASATFAHNAAEAVLTVKLGATDTNYVAEVDWQTVDGTASNGVDFVSAGGTLRWEVGETRSAKTISVPILVPQETTWQNRSFTVCLYPKSHCAIPEAMSSCSVTLSPNSTRNAGTVAFDESWSTARPVFHEGELFTADILRTGGYQGSVSATATLVTKGYSHSQAFEWGNNDREPKKVEWAIPATAGMQDDKSAYFELSASGGAALGSPNKAQFIVRDSLAEASFAEYNATVLGGAASVSGDAWFYGREFEGAEECVFRSRTLSSSGTALSIAVKGPAVLDLSVLPKGDAAAALSLGNAVLDSDYSGRHFVAVPAGSQTVTIKGTRGTGGDSYLVANWTVSPIASLRLVATNPADCSWVRVAGDFSLAAQSEDMVELPEGVSIDVVTLVGTSSSALAELPSDGKAKLSDGSFTYPSAGSVEESSSLLGFATNAVGSHAWWRMDASFTDEYGNVAVREGAVAVMRLLPVDAPDLDVAGGLPSGWTASDSSVLLAPTLTAGVSAAPGKLSVANVGKKDSVSVNIRSGSLPPGMSVFADGSGISFAGVPNATGVYESEFQLVTKKSSGEVVQGATFRVAFTIASLGGLAANYTGYRIFRTADNDVLGACSGAASLSVGPSGLVDGRFTYRGERFAFSTGPLGAISEGVALLSGVTAASGSSKMTVSAAIYANSEEHDAVILAGDTEYWLYKGNWHTAAGRGQLREVVGAYAAALTVVGCNPADSGLLGNGYLCARVHESGIVDYFGLDSIGRRFSGTSPAFHVFDCCTGSGKKWFFHVDARPTGCTGAEAGIFGLVAIEPDAMNPSIRYLSTDEKTPLNLVNLDGGDISPTCWTNVLAVVGGTYDIPSGMDSALAQAVFDANGWKAKVDSYGRNTGEFTATLPSGDKVRGVHVPHAADGKQLWSGLSVQPDGKTEGIVWE